MPDLAVYILDVEAQPKKVAECDDDALGFCLRTLTDEEQIGEMNDVGILDLGSRSWIVNPFPVSIFGRRV